MHMQILTAAERADLTTKLAEARDAYHSLSTGIQARVAVDQNGERVEFTAANSARLAQYITTLELKLAPSICDVQSLVGPATFYF